MAGVAIGLPKTAGDRLHAGTAVWLASTRAVLLAALVALSSGAAWDVSPAPILQWFESSYDTVERRTPDLFMAGYAGVWLPPPGRADLSDFSVGYDVYDRFDLGRPRHPTLYGTVTGLKTVGSTFHRAGVDLHIDAIINHNGFSDLGTPGFVAAGGYPGMAITLPYDVDGDFNSAFDWGDVRGRLAGLVDIDHGKNHRYIRHPVAPDDPRNIPLPGTIPDGAGRLANVPHPANRRFYPDRDLQPIFVYDPATGEGDIPIYPFNLTDPAWGDPVEENATGYLMRYLQWMVQVIGVDGFRIDAAKHVEGFAFGYFDRAVYRQNPRPNLDGSTRHVFSYSEVFDGDKGFLQTFVKKTIDPGQPGVVGGNRDVLDFPLQFALRGNLTGNGSINNWYNVRDAAMDLQDDGLHNGSQGVMFVGSHDEPGPELSNVAQAYVLMHPGNAVVYFNGREFGDGRDFPKDGRGDALGGVWGDYITRLVQIRNTHGRGNYHERWIEKEIFAFERAGSAVVLLSNRTDAGYDSRTLQTTFAAGTPLVELTGAAADPGVDPRDDVPDLLVVNGDGTVNVRFLRNSSFDRNMNSFFHGSGALVYGLSGPQAPGGLELSGVAFILPGGNPAPNAYQNGVTRLADLHVVSGDTFQASLRTVEVNLLGFYRDVWADGDNALIKLDGGTDVNGNGYVDFTAPGTPSYGFEQFADKREPLIGPNGLGDPEWQGDGEFRQTIDATQLSEGTHFIEVRAFRHRTDGGPAIYSSFKKAVYIDRLPPISAAEGFLPFDSSPQVPENQDLLIRSADLTADNVSVFLDQPANVPRAEFIQRALSDEGQAGRIDRDLFAYGFFALTHGNHVATVVTFEPTGNVNVQRFPGLFVETGIGRGLGDLNFDGLFSPSDLANVPGAFEEVLWSRNDLFNPAADPDGNGLVNAGDLLLLERILADGLADGPTMSAYQGVKMRRVDFNLDGSSDDADFRLLRSNFGGRAWLYDLNSNGVVDRPDQDLLTGEFGVAGETSVVASASEGSWHAGNTWQAGIPPTTNSDAEVLSHTVAVAADGRARSLLINDSEGLLTIATQTNLTIGEDVAVVAGTLETAPTGKLTAGRDFIVRNGSICAAKLSESGSGMVEAAGSVALHAGSSLSVEATGPLNSVGNRAFTIVTAANVDGTFTNEPADGDHLGYGVFHRSVDYSETTSVKVNVFQAIAGDANGDRSFDFGDLVRVFAASGAIYGNPAPPAPAPSWPQGDFTADGAFTFSDLIKAFGDAGAYYGGTYPLAAGMMLSESDLATDLTVTGSRLGGGYVEDVRLIVNEVPEPGTPATLAVFALTSLLGYTWRRRRPAAQAHHAGPARRSRPYIL